MLNIDLHVHTIHSGHAYGSLYEVLNEAKSNNMEMIAITDHGPSMEGSAPEVHFKMASRAPKNFKGMEVLWGCEANIIDGKGKIDLNKKIIKMLDILLVGMHIGCPYEDLGKKGNTKAIINCFEKYPISIFSHPTTLYYQYDLDKVFQSACDNDILLELNLSSLNRLSNGHHREDLDRVKKMIEIVKKNNKKVIITSDCHFLHELGDDTILKKHWNELGLNNKLIINNFKQELKAFIASKK
jgi:putative hydrolase|tara:strand:- start:3200 stop:3922 length:723 start_codon:yes stop_codon:yes gene_type:complete